MQLALHTLSLRYDLKHTFLCPFVPFLLALPSLLPVQPSCLLSSLVLLQVPTSKPVSTSWWIPKSSRCSLLVRSGGEGGFSKEWPRGPASDGLPGPSVALGRQTTPATANTGARGRRRRGQAQDRWAPSPQLAPEGASPASTLISELQSLER